MVDADHALAHVHLLRRLEGLDDGSGDRFPDLFGRHVAHGTNITRSGEWAFTRFYLLSFFLVTRDLRARRRTEGTDAGVEMSRDFRGRPKRGGCPERPTKVAASPGGHHPRPPGYDTSGA